MTLRLNAAIVATVCFSSMAQAYENPVHKAMTQRAFRRASVDWQQRLGFGVETKPGLDARTHIGEGAFNEDEPPTRVVNHFLDPVNQVGIAVPPACNDIPFLHGIRADSWATDVSAPNQYGIRSARNEYFEALTGLNPGVRGGAQNRMFTTLGHMVHLVQDMAQPEHTRNDIHLILPGPFAFMNDVITALVGERMPSLYEAWALQFIGGNPDTSTVDLDGYPNVQLPDYKSYFHTADGRGLADYSNRNFVTQDTNYGDYDPLLNDTLPKCFRYSSPSLDLATVRIRPTVSYATLDADGTCCDITTVHDEAVYTWITSDGEYDYFHTLHSSLDMEAQKYDVNASFYSLSDDSYQRRAEILIPRAVGYSAGFIEHFFRGKISATWKRTNSGSLFSHELRITNLSQEKIGADAVITATYTADPAYFGSTNNDDSRIIFRTELSDLAPSFTGLEPGATVSFVVPSIYGLRDSDSITQFERRIAIRGTLGDEDDAVIGLVQPAQSQRLTRVARFDDLVPLGATVPYFQAGNIGSGSRWNAESGGVSLGDPWLNTSSALYATKAAAPQITFRFYEVAFKPRVRVVNGPGSPTLFIFTSNNHFFEGSLFQTLKLEAFEERIVELPETGVVRFTIRGQALMFGIDDVMWEVDPPTPLARSLSNARRWSSVPCPACAGFEPAGGVRPLIFGSRQEPSDAA
jgi:hypothetical protein